MSSSVDHAVAGALAGMAAMAGTYPLTNWVASRQTGRPLQGLYAGLESALVGISAVNFLYYYVSHAIRRLFRARGVLYLSVPQSLVANVVAGIIACVATNPIWVANTKMSLARKAGQGREAGQSGDQGGQSADKKQEPDTDEAEQIQQIQHELKYTNTLSTLVEIYKEGGVQELMAGLTPALILVSSPVIQFTLYEQIKNVIIKRRGHRADSITAKDALIWGSVTKLVALMITYPYYTLRARLHMDTHNLSMVAMVKKLYKEEGLASFYGGLNAKLVQSVLNAGLVFYLKEIFINFRHKQTNTKKTI